MRSGPRLLMGGLVFAALVTPAAVRAANDKAPAVEAKAEKTAKETDPKVPAKADPKPTDPKTVDPKAVDPKAVDTKTGGDKLREGKAPEGKAKDDKPDGKGKGEGKADGEKAGEGEPAAEKTARPRKKKSTASNAPATIPGEGPSPASPPPLTMGGLRDELRRESAVGKIDPGASPRTKVEQMLSEIVKTREAVHAETLRLEGMMAQEPGEGTAAGGPAAGGAGGKPAKNPLDILAKALRGIKPEQAAPIVSRLDKRLAATVLQRMPPVDAGKIMGAMKPDTAAELATQIAMRVPGSDGKVEVRK
jgi:flagellar motility protein MotE (MotC chaperone)